MISSIRDDEIEAAERPNESTIPAKKAVHLAPIRVKIIPTKGPNKNKVTT